MSDLTVRLEEGKLNIRVAAWIEKDGQILVSQFPDGHISLPGGRMQFGETSLEAIQREILEEVGTELLSPRLLAVIENHFEVDVAFHELQFVYQGAIRDGHLMENGDDESQLIEWAPLTDIARLKPKVYSKLIGKSLGFEVLHLVNYDMETGKEVG